MSSHIVMQSVKERGEKNHTINHQYRIAATFPCHFHVKIVSKTWVRRAGGIPPLPCTFLKQYAIVPAPAADCRFLRCHVIAVWRLSQS